MRVTYQQLDQDALQLVEARVRTLGSRAAVAAELGYARSTLSLAMDGKYPGETKHLRAAIIAAYASRVLCPHLGTDIAPARCLENRTRTLQQSLGSREAVKQWQACQTCTQNPNATRQPEDAA